MADSPSPDAIQREIEATRAELADTIDAIADRMSPKRVVNRNAQAVKAKAVAAFGHGESGDGGRMSPNGVPTDLDAVDTMTVNGRPASVLDATPEQAARSEPVAFHEQRTLRTDRVLFLVGVGAALVGAVVLLRGRRR